MPYVKRKGEVAEYRDGRAKVSSSQSCHPTTNDISSIKEVHFAGKENQGSSGVLPAFNR